jgi:hypothetical protein
VGHGRTAGLRRLVDRFGAIWHGLGVILRDYRCSACQNLQEGLEPGEPCESCGGPTVEQFSYRPSQRMDPVMASVMAKGATIRKKLQGKLPWRKSSWSQTD